MNCSRARMLLMLSFSLLPMQTLYAVGFEPGHLIVGSSSSSDPYSQSFWDVDPQTGAKTLLTRVQTGFINSGMVVTTEGRLFIAQDQVWRVLEILPDSGTYRTVANIHENLRDIVEGPNGALWVLSNYRLRLLQQDTGQPLISYPIDDGDHDGPNNPFHIAVGRDGSVLKSYLSAVGDGDGGIVQVDPATGIEQTLVANLDNPGAMCPDSAGNLYFLDQRYQDNRSRVLRFDGQTGQVTELETVPLRYQDDLLRGDDGRFYWKQILSFTGVYNSNIYSWDTVNQPSLLANFPDEYIVGMTIVPVPEPVTAALLALGALVVRRRK